MVNQTHVNCDFCDTNHRVSELVCEKEVEGLLFLYCPKEYDEDDQEVARIGSLEYPID